MNALTVSVIGTPAPQGSKRGFVNRHSGKVSMVESSSERVKTWRADVREAATRGVEDGLWLLERGPVAVTIDFYLARPKGHYGTGRNAAILKSSAAKYPAGKPDLDKLERATLDALTLVLFADDSQVVQLATRKRWADIPLPSGAIITIRTLT